MSDKLVLERKDGWPNGLSHICLLCSVLMYLWSRWLPDPHASLQMARLAGLSLMCALVLRLYRRGTLLDKRIRTLHRWWGVAIPFVKTIPIRYAEDRSLQGYKEVRVKPTSRYETWKTWRKGMMHVQLERPDDKLGPESPFRVRLIVDDEITSLQAATETAQKVAVFLELPCVIQTTGDAR